ncbi:MAG: hypothetical protein LBP78_01995 [Acidaminococcales bacterium]|nr:hypothetical protein [Acidaminococcales bacterium]
MSAIPRTYYDWTVVLNELKEKNNDQETLRCMHEGTIEWQAGVAERFAQKLTEAINCRMNMAADKFQKDMNNARGQDRGIVQALLSLRGEMGFLLQAINLPVIPEKDRGQYAALVRAQADRIQQSLEASAQKDRSGKLSSIVRNHKVNWGMPSGEEDAL